MGHFRPQTTFNLVADDEVAIYHEGSFIGSIHKDECILNPGTYNYLIHLDEDPRGWERIGDRRNLRTAVDRRIRTHPLYR